MNWPSKQLSLAGFWQERAGWTHLKEKLLLAPVPGGSRWVNALAWLLPFLFLFEVATGILLSFAYAPAVKTAWPSVQSIQHEMPLGSSIRAFHYWGANAMVILVLLQVVRLFISGGYKRPGELIWIVGLLLLLLVLLLTHTGALLPWDQSAYWGTKVRLGIIGNTPALGESLRDLLQDGPQIGNRTLTRFFTLHALILPGVFLVLMLIDRYLHRLHRPLSALGKAPSPQAVEAEPFWPGQAWKNGLVLLVCLAGLGILSLACPAPLEEKADPSRLYEARPEWYFLFLFQLRKYFQGHYEIVATFVLPTAVSLGLVLWPFLDRTPHRDPRRRPVAMALLGVGVCTLVGLTALAILTDAPTHSSAQAAPPPPLAPAKVSSSIQQSDIANLYSINCSACHGLDGTGRQLRAQVPNIPDFTNAAWQLSHTELDLIHLVQHGKPPLMPAYRDKLAHQEILALAFHIRSFSSGPSERVNASRDQPPPPPMQPPLAVGPAGPPEVASVEKPPHANAAQLLSGQTGPMTPRASQPTTTSTSAETAARAHAATGLYRKYCLICHGADGRASEMRASTPAIPDFSSRSWQDRVSTPQLVVSILDGKGTLMPAFRGRVGGKQAQDLAAYVRGFGPGAAAPPEPPAGDFEKRFRELQAQQEELQRQFHELSKPPPEP
jgi:ubiquinol-cytochrome c reductase cytochrome b subunit